MERATQAAREGGAGAAVKQIVGELTDKVVKDVAEGRRNMDDLQQRHDDDEKIAKWQDKGRGGMFDWLVGDTSRAATEKELGKLQAKERKQGLSPLDRIKKRKLEGEIAGQEDAWSRDQMRRVGPLPDPVTSTSPEFADAIEGAREARRAAAFRRTDAPVERSATATKPGAAQRGRVQPPARPKAIGATAFPGYGTDDAPTPTASVSTPRDREPPASAKPPAFRNDTAKLPENPQGNAASNSLFSGESLSGQTPDPRLTKTAPMSATGAFSPPPTANGLGEVQSKADAAKASVESLGSSGASAGSALATGISSGLSSMEAQVAASVARMQQQLNSLKAPSLSMGGLGGFNTGKGMAEVK